MKKDIIILLIAFISLSVFQKSKANDHAGDSINTPGISKVFALEEYQEDYKKMVKLLVNKHPQPYAFISEDSFKKLTDIQYNKITESTTLGEFLWICQKVTAAINCGHTWLWANEINNLPNPMVFPMNVRYVGSRLYIIDAKDNSDQLSAGDEILTINGVKVETLKEEIFNHLPSDGFIESSKHEFTNRLFRPYFAMYFNFPTSYAVTVHKNGKAEEIKLKVVEKIEPTKSFLDDCKDQLCFDTDEKSNTAIITIRSFAFYRKKLPVFKSFIDSCFQQINDSKIENLIIDLRNNGGGDPFCGTHLIQYIANKPYTYFHKDVWINPSLKKTIHPNSNRFKNKPYILTNGFCTSTTGHFSSIVKENNFGIFVGDETGATYTCNDNSKFFTLKNTKLSFRVPRNTYYTSASTLTNKHGIIPDHPIIPDIGHILNNTDVVLDYTLKLIEQK